MDKSTEIYVNSNCRFCKNTNTCELHAFLLKGWKIDNIKDIGYECDHINEKHGIKFASVSDDI